MRIILILSLVGTIFFSSCNSSKTEESTKVERHEPKSPEEKVSYSIGILASSSIIMRLEKSGIMNLIMPDKMAKGINDFVAGKEIEIDPKTAKENLSLFFRNLQETGKAPEMGEKDKAALSYSIGVDAIREVYGQITETKADTVIDIRFVVEAMNHFILGEELFIQPDKAEQNVREFFAAAQAKKNEKLLVQYEPNKIAGQEYLAENGKKQGVKTTQSGLQIETLKPGKGAQVKLGDTVAIHYTGTLIDGTKFDSSHDRNEPYVIVADYNFPVIAGWIEGALQMKDGGKYKITIPYELAYKDRLGSPIPPFSTLIFEMEIVSINKAKL